MSLGPPGSGILKARVYARKGVAELNYWILASVQKVVAKDAQALAAMLRK